MIENLLHESVVLSEDQADAVRKQGTPVPEDRKIAIITFLGVDTKRDEVHVLVRFSEGKCSHPIAPTIKEVFGMDVYILFGHGSEASQFIPGYRIIATMLLSEEIRYPKGILRTKARQLAESFVKWQAPE